MKQLLGILCGLALLCSAEDVTFDKPVKFNSKLGVVPVSDAKYAGGSAYRFDISQGGWSMEFNPLAQSNGKITGEDWDFYAVLRLEKPQKTGPVFWMGMYSYSRKKDLFKKLITADTLSADEGTTVFIGSTKNPEGAIWAGGPSVKDSNNAVILERLIARKSQSVIPEEFAGKQVIDIQKIHYTPQRCKEVFDTEASDGRAYRFLGKAQSWSFNCAPDSGKAIAGNPWRAYAYIRAEGEGTAGDIFEVGLFDQNTKQHVMNVKVPMEYVKGNQYQQIDLGTVNWKKGMYFWGGPQAKNDVTYVYLDRIILVSERGL